MSKNALIFEVNDSNYGKYVLLNSHKVPVVMAFVGVWSEHCYSLDITYSALAEEFPEEFVFAKLDVDQNPETMREYDIQNVPTVIVFKDGEPHRREEGLLTQDEARALLKDYGIYRESDELRNRARILHVQGETPRAITLLADAIKKDPTNVRVALDMVQIFIDIGEIDEAEKLFEKLPAAEREGQIGTGLHGQMWIIRKASLTEGLNKLEARIESDGNDYDARFDAAICMVAQHNYHDAMGHLFYIQEQKADYKEGAAREMIVSLINSLTIQNPAIAQLYRQQLANMLNA